MSWVLAFAGFALLIILHEAGHFAAAKAVGMRVERFFLFFPPKIWSIKRGETEYGIGAIPLGGFVRITGMNPEEKLEPEVAPRAYSNQPVWKRIVVIAAGPAVNLVIAFVILFALGFSLEEPTSLAVGDIEHGSPAQGHLEAGDKLISINGVKRGEGTADEQSSRLVDALGRPPLRRRADGRLPCDDGGSGRGSARRQDRDDPDAPVLRREAGRFRFGFSFVGAGFVPADQSIGGSASFAARPDVDGDLADGQHRRADLQRRGAQADLRRRRQLRGDPRSRSTSTPARRSSCSP